MKFNKESGITLISLMVTVMILGIITSITVYTGVDIIKKANLQNINTNMMLIQAKTKTMAEQAKFNNDISNYKGTTINNVIGNKYIDKIKSLNIIEDDTKYYLLSQDDLASMGLQKVDIEQGYIVNYDTDEIIYVKGFEVDGKTYYKLSETKTLTF